MKKSVYLIIMLSLFCITACTSTIKVPATEKIEYTYSGLFYNIPKDITLTNCPDKVDTKCYKDGLGNKELQITQLSEDLSSVTYDNPPAGLSYRYYPEYDAWVDPHDLEDEGYNGNIQQKKDCLLRKIGRSAVSLSLIPRAYAGGGEFICEEWIKRIQDEQNLDIKPVLGGLRAYVFSSGDGIWGWKTAFIERPDKSQTYRIVCSASDNFIVDKTGKGEYDNTRGIFLDICINTVLESWKF